MFKRDYHSSKNFHIPRGFKIVSIYVFHLYEIDDVGNVELGFRMCKNHPFNNWVVGCLVLVQVLHVSQTNFTFSMNY